MPSKPYEIGSGLSEQDLKAASWWVKNGAGMRRLGYGILIVFSTVSWGYVIWTLLDTYAISYPREQRIIANILQNHQPLATLQTAAPQPIEAGSVLIFDSTGQRLDYAVQIHNPNALWWAEFTYRFSSAGKPLADHHSFILPNDQRYLTEFGVTGGARDATIDLADIVWHRVDPNQVNRNYDTFASQRWQMAFDNVTYKNDLVIEGKNVGQTSFTLRNPSAFGFRSVDLTIILSRTDAPAAIGTLNVKNIKPGESRALTFNWFENPLYVSRTEILPSTNLLDPASFLSTTEF